MVGTIYMAAAPGSPNFIEVGAEVKQGQTLLIIEAMKTMNQIPSPVAGKVIRIHVENGDPVDYGAARVTIEYRCLTRYSLQIGARLPFGFFEPAGSSASRRWQFIQPPMRMPCTCAWQMKAYA